MLLRIFVFFSEWVGPNLEVVVVVWYERRAVNETRCEQGEGTIRTERQREVDGWSLMYIIVPLYVQRKC